MDKSQIKKELKDNLNPVINLFLSGGYLMIIVYFIHLNEIVDWIALGGSLYCVLTIIYYKILINFGLALKLKK